MAETIYDEINELKKAIGEESPNPKDGDDNGKDDESSVQQDRPVRRRGGSVKGKHAEQGAVPELGGTGERGDSEGSPRDEGGASPGDARTQPRRSRASRGADESAQSESGGTQEDARTPQEDGEEVLEKPLSNADWARQRRELREAKAELSRLKAAQTSPRVEASTEVKPAAEVTLAVDPKSAEPDRNVNYQEWLEWKLQQQDNTLLEQSKLVKDYQDWRSDQKKNEDGQRLISEAVRELSTIEESYKRQNPDYLNAVDFGRNKYADALKITNPRWNQQQIDTKIDHDILLFCSDCSQKGLNPAEELYDMMIERFGYAKKDASEEEVSLPRRIAEKPNLKAISNNRRRTASPLSGGGQGGASPMTKEWALDMSIGEFANLSPSDLAELEAM